MKKLFGVLGALALVVTFLHFAPQIGDAGVRSEGVSGSGWTLFPGNMQIGDNSGNDTVDVSGVLEVDSTLTVGGAMTITGAATVSGAATLSGNVMTAGAGFTDGAGVIYKNSVSRIGTLIKTEFFIDLTGDSSSTTDLDIIGAGTKVAHFGQITAALNGTILYGQVTCLETPATGVDDIDIYYCTEGTGVFDQNFSALTETAVLTKGGGWSAAAATPIAITGLPAANSYLYLACGASGTPATYSAGQFLVELWGY